MSSKSMTKNSLKAHDSIMKQYAKNFKHQSFITKKSEECIIPPNSFVLASTVEYFKIPFIYGRLFSIT